LINNELSLSDYKKISEDCKNFITEMFNQPTVTKQNAQSIFFFYAILKTKVRSIESGEFKQE